MYIEASSEPDAKAAVKGLRIIYGYKIHVVPHADMTRVMTVKSRARAPVTKGAWVRLKRDKYKGDLAKVVHVTADGARAIVQHVPRLELDGANAANDPSKKSGNAVRAPQRLFFDVTL